MPPKIKQSGRPAKSAQSGPPPAKRDIPDAYKPRAPAPGAKKGKTRPKPKTDDKVSKPTPQQKSAISRKKNAEVRKAAAAAAAAAAAQVEEGDDDGDTIMVAPKKSTPTKNAAKKSRKAKDPDEAIEEDSPKPPSEPSLEPELARMTDRQAKAYTARKEAEENAKATAGTQTMGVSTGTVAATHSAPAKDAPKQGTKAQAGKGEANASTDESEPGNGKTTQKKGAAKQNPSIKTESKSSSPAAEKTKKRKRAASVSSNGLGMSSDELEQQLEKAEECHEDLRNVFRKMLNDKYADPNVRDLVKQASDIEGLGVKDWRKMIKEAERKEQKRIEMADEEDDED